MTATAITKPMKAQQWQKKNYHEPKEAQFLTVLHSVNQSICTQGILDFLQELRSILSMLLSKFLRHIKLKWALDADEVCSSQRFVKESMDLKANSGLMREK